MNARRILAALKEVAAFFRGKHQLTNARKFIHQENHHEDKKTSYRTNSRQPTASTTKSQHQTG